MREPACSATVGRRLARHGLPSAHIERMMRELADHWEDLRLAAMESGLSETAAAAEADLKLGRPEQLAARLIAGFRANSWLGRHPVAALCVAPLLFPPLLMGMVVLPLYWLLGAFSSSPSGYILEQFNPHLVTGSLWAAYYAAIVGSVLWLCWRVWSSGLGIRWVMAMCSWCALAALLRYFEANPNNHRIVVGFTFPYQLNIHTAALLAIHGTTAGAFLLAAWRARRGTLQHTLKKSL